MGRSRFATVRTLRRVYRNELSLDEISTLTRFEVGSDWVISPVHLKQSSWDGPYTPSLDAMSLSSKVHADPSSISAYVSIELVFPYTVTGTYLNINLFDSLLACNITAVSLCAFTSAA